MAANQLDTENVVSDGNEIEMNLKSNSDGQKEDDDKGKEGLKNRDEKSVDGVNEKGKEEDNDSSYDNDRDYDYDYPQYSYQEEIDNFIYGTPDERAVEEYWENNHNWMGD